MIILIKALSSKTQGSALAGNVCVRWNIIQSVSNSVVFHYFAHSGCFDFFLQRVAASKWFEHVFDSVP